MCFRRAGDCRLPYLHMARVRPFAWRDGLASSHATRVQSGDRTNRHTTLMHTHRPRYPTKKKKLQDRLQTPLCCDSDAAAECSKPIYLTREGGAATQRSGPQRERTETLLSVHNRFRLCKKRREEARAPILRLFTIYSEKKIARQAREDRQLFTATPP